MPNFRFVRLLATIVVERRIRHSTPHKPAIQALFKVIFIQRAVAATEMRARMVQ